MQQSDLPVALRQRVFSPRGVVLLATIATVLGAVALVGRHYLMRHQQSVALQDAARAQELLNKGDRDEGLDLLSQAYRHSPTDPDIWRIWAQVLSNWQQPDDDRAHYFWKQLERSGHASAEDRLRLGICSAHLGHLDEAQAILASQDAHGRSERWGLELESAILRAHGQVDLANQKLIQALTSAPEDPECQLQLAIINLRSPFAEQEEDSAQKLWKLAKQPGRYSSEAMKALAKQATLTPEQAEELRRLLKEQKSVSQDVRLVVLQAYLAHHPEEKAAVVAEEMKRFPGMTERESLHFLSWLGLLGEHERLLAKVQKEKALLSPELCPIYLDSLAALHRWSELQDVLHGHATLPLAALDFALLQARCSRGLNESEKLVQTSLEEASREAMASHDPSKIERVAFVTENFGYQDLTINCLQAMTGNAQYEIVALERILSLQMHGSNASDALKTVQRILVARPGLHPYVTQELYLKLLLGLEIESTTSQAERFSASEKERSIRDFLKALGAFRQADLGQAQKEIEQINPVWLTSGQRAVLAGLLAMCGVSDRAFSIAEKVSPSLLLDEERKFLEKAL